MRYVSFIFYINRRKLLSPNICACDGIGRHAGFRFLCRKTCGFESLQAHHVVADYVSFATTFLLKSHRLTHAVTPPFRKKLRSAHLLSCKRPRDGSLSLPTFCGFKFTTLSEAVLIRFLRRAAAFCRSLRSLFY